MNVQPHTNGRSRVRAGAALLVGVGLLTAGCGTTASDTGGTASAQIAALSAEIPSDYPLFPCNLFSKEDIAALAGPIETSFKVDRNGRTGDLSGCGWSGTSGDTFVDIQFSLGNASVENLTNSEEVSADGLGDAAYLYEKHIEDEGRVVLHVIAGEDEGFDLYVWATDPSRDAVLAVGQVVAARQQAVLSPIGPDGAPQLGPDTLTCQEKVADWDHVHQQLSAVGSEPTSFSPGRASESFEYLAEFAQERVEATQYPPLKAAMQRAADIGAQVGEQAPSGRQNAEMLAAIEDQGRACVEGGIAIDWLTS